MGLIGVKRELNKDARDRGYICSYPAVPAYQGRAVNKTLQDNDKRPTRKPRK